MKMEFTALKDLLMRGLYLQGGDYVYRHDREDYPLQKDLDASNLHVIITANGHKLKIVSFIGIETDVDLEAEKGYWWVLKLPDLVRKQMGLQ